MVVALLVALACAGAAACANAAPPSPSAAPFEVIELTTPDGLTLAGRSYGSGDTAVVLGHMAGPTSNQEDWRPVAERLAANGHRVLTYNRTGVCDPDGTACSERRGGAQNAWADMVAAAEWLRSEGAARVIVGGASAGAMAALRAAEVAPHVDGVIWMAGGLRGSGYDFNEEDVAQIQAPLLLISSTEDPTTSPRGAELLAAWATAPAEVLMLESNLHGTDVLEGGGPTAATLLATIERFVDGIAGADAPEPSAVSDFGRSGGRAWAVTASPAVPGA